MRLLPFNYSIDILMSRIINKYYYVVITGSIFGLTYLARGPTISFYLFFSDTI